MSYSNKTTGNITIIKPDKCYSKVSNNIILDSRISHTALRIALFLNLKHENWFFTKEELMESLSISKNVYSDAIKQLKEFGYLEVNKISKGKGNGFTYQYCINTEGYTDPRKWDVETIRDPRNHTYTDPRKWDVDKPSNNQVSKVEPSNSLIPTTSQKVGSIFNTDINNKTINNTKEKIYKKESEDSLDLYDQTVKLMKDKLLLMTKPENLIKEFGLEEVNKHLAYLDYFDLDKQHEKYKRNLTFSFLESLRNNLEAPPEYRRIQHQAIYEERMITAKPILDLFNIKSRNEIDLYLETCKSINQMKKKDKLNLNQYLKHELELVDNKRRRLGQYVLSFEEKSKLIEDLTLNYEVEKNQRISLAKQTVQHDIKKFFNITKIVIKENPLSLMSLKDDLQEFNNNVNDYLFNLEIFILRLSNKDLENCA